MNFAKELEQYNVPPELYNGLPIQTMNTEDFIPLIRRELMKEAYTPDLSVCEDAAEREHAERLNQRIEQAWIKETGTVFSYSAPVIPFGHGSPGHGKTTSFRVAAKQFANAVGLNFVDRPSNDFVPTFDDFLYIQQEMAGEVSSITQGGLVVKGVDDKDREYMHKVPLRQLQMAQDAGFSMLVYDDVKNAGPSIQNILMAMMEERAFQGNKLGRMAVGATGNIGVDGTNISQSSTANLTRTQNFLVYDSVGNFVSRVLNRQQNSRYEGSDIGADAVLSFLMKQPEFFTENIKKGGKSAVTGTHANPRTWAKCIELMREMCDTYMQQQRILKSDLNDPVLKAQLSRAAEQMGLSKDDKQLSELQDMLKESAKKDLESNPLNRRVESKVKGILGTNDAGRAFHDYMYRRLSYGTDLLASEIMKNGQLSQSSEQQFINQYKGHSIEAKDFGHHMVMSMAEAAAQPLAKAMREKDLEQVKEVAQRFTKGMIAPASIKLDGQEYNVALDDGEVNRGVYFLMSKTTHALNDNSVLKTSSTGYMMEPEYLQAFLTGVAQEPAAAQKVTPNSDQTRYDGIANLLANKKESSHINVTDLESKIEQARKETAVSANEANSIAQEAQPDAPEAAPAAEQSQPEPKQTEQPQSKPESDPEPEPETKPEPVNEPAPVATDSFEAAEELEPEPEDGVAAADNADNKSSKETEKKPEPSFDDLDDGFELDDDLDLDDDFEPPAPSRGMG